MTRKPDTKQIDAIEARVGLSKEQRRILHAEIHGVGLGFAEILAEAERVKRDYSGKTKKRDKSKRHRE